jgi:hypothetical protein
LPPGSENGTPKTPCFAWQLFSLAGRPAPAPPRIAAETWRAT